MDPSAERSAYNEFGRRVDGKAEDGGTGVEGSVW
eukprot:CAMPEP_0197694790 /NCGR_PEP_ID=MMETSP1338-20131121/114303_1 /TAXON_ID=43686 ORGANISM="Pelagodinium beii, Strain RCC1491" /NCGR_SAMPLE_ID=MMETSP1338 /ASSEMBLY_ACC=CAM_ASM_000754 /LENGTH=33 /DNA_ID= /DNA_START= /DNA_END= /DNA_ORIENTATION=